MADLREQREQEVLLKLRAAYTGGRGVTLTPAEVRIFRWYFGQKIAERAADESTSFREVFIELNNIFRKLDRGCLHEDIHLTSWQITVLLNRDHLGDDIDKEIDKLEEKIFRKGSG